MSLWEEGRDQFLKDLRDQGVDKQTADQFLQDKAASEDVKLSCLSLQADSERKYGQFEIAGKGIPKKWIARIMDNVGKFVAIGDFAMKGAPETVGLVWFAIKQVLNAVQNNYKLYDFFGYALTNITEMLVLIQTYDKLYDERKMLSWQASDIVGELFSQIRNVYAAILDFSYSVKRHIKGGKMAKVGHAIKDMFGADLPEFEGKMGAIQALKVKILEGSQGAFQTKTFEKLDNVNASLTNVTGTLAFLSETVQSSLQGTQEMKQLLEDSLQLSKFKSIYDLALQEFEKNKKNLNPLLNSHDDLEVYIRQHEKDTCTWIHDLEGYKSWRESQLSNILCVNGEPGSGKSVLLASITQSLQSELEEQTEYAVQYLFCDSSKVGDESAQNLVRIQNTLIYQLYKLCTSREEDSVLLQRCNDVFKNPKHKKAQNSLAAPGKDAGLPARSKKEETSPDLGEAFESLARLLGKKLFLVIDAVDCVPDSDQPEFLSDLQDLVARPGLQIRILLSCRPTETFAKQLDDYPIPQISMEAHNRSDIDLVIVRGLKSMPGWSDSEREESHRMIREKTGSIFKYIVQVAMPFLRQPFQRPISNRLKELPNSMIGTYDRFLRQLAPNYLGLLRTALAWTLLADADVTVQEIMDAYTGIYLTQNTIDNTMEHVSLEDSKLHIKQIRDAGGPFLNIVDNHIVRLKDPTSIREFCRQLADDEQSNHECTTDLCARCRTELNYSHSLSFSASSGHLAIAITCLRHLNSTSFQNRYLPAGPSDPTTTTTTTITRLTDQQNNDREPFEGDFENGVEFLHIHGGGAEEDSTYRPDHAVDSKYGYAIDYEATGGLNDQPAVQTVDDDDDSQDSEDRDEPGWADNQIGDQDQEDYDWDGQILRYEISHWFFHVRQAEDLWTLEERRDRNEWGDLLSELDRFITKTPDAFDAWKRLQFSFDGVFWEPLHVAAFYGLCSLAEHLLSQGADIKTTSKGGLTPLHLAAENACPINILRLLLCHGAEPNSETDESEIPAFHHWMSWNADFACVQELLRHGASCKLMGQNGSNVMHYFAFYGSDPRILDLLLDNEEDPNNRANINVEDDSGETPLHKLMSRTNIPQELLKAFVKRGANLDAESKASEKPLYEAAMYGETDAISVIINSVTDINDDNKYGRTALHAAAWEGQMETVKLLLEHNMSPNRMDKHNRTPLFFACLCSFARLASSEATAQILLDRLQQDGFKLHEINQRTKRGRTPLREAAAHGFIRVVEAILIMIEPKDTKTINVTDTWKGRSALHCAALHGHADIVGLLLCHGADVTLKDGPDATGHTALELCHAQWATLASTQHEATLSTLIDYDSTAAARNRDLLATAAINGSKSILEKLLDEKADLNEPDQYGWTPLLLAQQFQRTEAVKLLSRRVAQIGMKPTKWTYTYNDEWMHISEDGCSLKHPQRSRHFCVLADNPIPAGLRKYYYEIEISRGPGRNGINAGRSPIFAIGFCTSSAHLLKFPGWPKENAPNSHSWAYHGDDGGFFSSVESSRPIGYSKPYGPGDTIGCGVNYDNSTIFFTRNGHRISDILFENVKGRLFPVLGFRDSIAITANFGNEVKSKPFRWSEEVESAKNAVQFQET